MIEKTEHNSNYIEFLIGDWIEFFGAKVPRRTFSKSYCRYLYRVMGDDGQFTYDGGAAQCPYVGESYFDANDNPVSDASKDSCGKSTRSCRLRFGNDNVIPGCFFPGVRQRNSR